MSFLKIMKEFNHIPIVRDTCKVWIISLEKTIKVKFDSLASQFDGNSSNGTKQQGKLIMRTQGFLSIVKIDTRSPPSRSYETAKMIGTEEFFSAS